IQKFLELQTLEKKTGASKVESEYLSFLSELEKKLPKEELNEVLRNVLEHRLGRVSYEEHYLFLNKYLEPEDGERVSPLKLRGVGGVMQENNNPSDSPYFKGREKQEEKELYPNLKFFAQQMSLMKQISWEKLDQEIKSLEEELIENLAVTSQAKELLELERDYDVLKRVVAMEGKREDLEVIWSGSYSPLKIRGVRGVIKEEITPSVPLKIRGRKNSQREEYIENFSQALKKLCEQTNLPFESPDFGDIFSIAQKFYAKVLERDQIMYKKTIKMMEERKLKYAALVIGGFHTERFKERLKAANIGYCVIAPRMNKADDRRVYFQKMKEFGSVVSGESKSDIIDLLKKMGKDFLSQAKLSDADFESWRTHSKFYQPIIESLMTENTERGKLLGDPKLLNFVNEIDALIKRGGAFKDLTESYLKKVLGKEDYQEFAQFLKSEKVQSGKTQSKLENPTIPLQLGLATGRAPEEPFQAPAVEVALEPAPAGEMTISPLVSSIMTARARVLSGEGALIDVLTGEEGLRDRQGVEVLIKPEATGCAGAIQDAIDFFHKHGYAMEAVSVRGPEAVKGILPEHYGASVVASIQGRKYLEQDAALTGAFKKNFNVDSLEGLRIFGGQELIEERGYSVDEIERAWDATKVKRLASGIYVCQVTLRGETVYLLNGHVSTLINLFTRPGAVTVAIRAVPRREDATPLLVLRDALGGTSIAEAKEGTLRKRYYTQLDSRPDIQSLHVRYSLTINGYHLSAQYLEALAEVVLWGATLEDQPLAQKLNRAGLSWEEIKELLTDRPKNIFDEVEKSGRSEEETVQIVLRMRAESKVRPLIDRIGKGEDIQSDVEAYLALRVQNPLQAIDFLALLLHLDGEKAQVFLGEVVKKMSEEVQQPSASDQNIVLASKSPRRKEILETMLGDKKEKLKINSPQGRENISPIVPYETAMRAISVEKALEIVEREKTGLIIASDTTMHRNGEVLGKVPNDISLEAYLEKISQFSHQDVRVVSSLVVVDSGTSQVRVGHEEAFIRLRPLGEVLTEAEKSILREIQAPKGHEAELLALQSVDQPTVRDVVTLYHKMGLFKGKAGGFGVQDRLFFLAVQHIRGNPLTIIGLPTEILKRTLTGLNVELPGSLESYTAEIWPSESERERLLPEETQVGQAGENKGSGLQQSVKGTKVYDYLRAHTVPRIPAVILAGIIVGVWEEVWYRNGPLLWGSTCLLAFISVNALFDLHGGDLLPFVKGAWIWLIRFILLTQFFYPWLRYHAKVFAQKHFKVYEWTYPNIHSYLTSAEYKVHYVFGLVMGILMAVSSLLFSESYFVKLFEISPSLWTSIGPSSGMPWIILATTAVLHALNNIADQFGWIYKLSKTFPSLTKLKDWIVMQSTGGGNTLASILEVAKRESGSLQSVKDANSENLQKGALIIRNGEVFVLTGIEETRVDRQVVMLTLTLEPLNGGESRVITLNDEAHAIALKGKGKKRATRTHYYIRQVFGDLYRQLTVTIKVRQFEQWLRGRNVLTSDQTLEGYVANSAKEIPDILDALGEQLENYRSDAKISRQGMRTLIEGLGSLVASQRPQDGGALKTIVIDIKMIQAVAEAGLLPSVRAMRANAQEGALTAGLVWDLAQGAISQEGEDENQVQIAREIQQAVGPAQTGIRSFRQTPIESSQAITRGVGYLILERKWRELKDAIKTIVINRIVKEIKVPIRLYVNAGMLRDPEKAQEVMGQVGELRKLEAGGQPVEIIFFNAKNDPKPLNETQLAKIREDYQTGDILEVENGEDLAGKIEKANDGPVNLNKKRYIAVIGPAEHLDLYGRDLMSHRIPTAFGNIEDFGALLAIALFSTDKPQLRAFMKDTLKFSDGQINDLLAGDHEIPPLKIATHLGRDIDAAMHAAGIAQKNM
ncbi:MAG: Maf family protein, partial [Chlamydiae bacterium]|nr:Maf family protein [Chlamydiota bacterium]